MVPRNQQTYSTKIYHGLESVDPVRDNVDVEVRFEDGSRFSATFFTLRNIQFLFDKFQADGEHLAGLYFHCPDMILVRDYSTEIVAETVRHLLTVGSFESAFVRLSDLDSSDVG